MGLDWLTPIVEPCLARPDYLRDGASDRCCQKDGQQEENRGSTFL